MRRKTPALSWPAHGAAERVWWCWVGQKARHAWFRRWSTLLACSAASSFGLILVEHLQPQPCLRSSDQSVWTVEWAVCVRRVRVTFLLNCCRLFFSFPTKKWPKPNLAIVFHQVLLSREMWSKAPTPSVDKMAASVCCSVRLALRVQHTRTCFRRERTLEWCHCCFHCLTDLLRNRLGHHPPDHVPSHNARNST